MRGWRAAHVASWYPDSQPWQDAPGAAALPLMCGVLHGGSQTRATQNDSSIPASRPSGAFRTRCFPPPTIASSAVSNALSILLSVSCIPPPGVFLTSTKTRASDLSEAARESVPEPPRASPIHPQNSGFWASFADLALLLQSPEQLCRRQIVGEFGTMVHRGVSAVLLTLVGLTFHAVVSSGETVQRPDSAGAVARLVVNERTSRFGA